jgi:hypothetical protein
VQCVFCYRAVGLGCVSCSHVTCGRSVSLRVGSATASEWSEEGRPATHGPFWVAPVISFSSALSLRVGLVAAGF